MKKNCDGFCLLLNSYWFSLIPRVPKDSAAPMALSFLTPKAYMMQSCMHEQSGLDCAFRGTGLSISCTTLSLPQDSWSYWHYWRSTLPEYALLPCESTSWRGFLEVLAYLCRDSHAWSHGGKQSIAVRRHDRLLIMYTFSDPDPFFMQLSQFFRSRLCNWPCQPELQYFRFLSRTFRFCLALNSSVRLTRMKRKIMWAA